MKDILANITNIQSGYHFKERIENDNNGEFQFIQLKDIDDYNRINYSSLLRNNLPNIKQTQLLEKGDILFKSRGMKFTASVVDEHIQNTIATSHFFIIKIKSRNIIPDYLAWFLNDVSTQKIIKLGIGGTRMQVLNKKFLENIEITIPSIDIQQKIINIKKLSEHEQKLLKRKNELRTLLVDLHLRKIIFKG